MTSKVIRIRGSPQKLRPPNTITAMDQISPSERLTRKPKDKTSPLSLQHLVFFGTSNRCKAQRPCPRFAAKGSGCHLHHQRAVAENSSNMDGHLLSRDSLTDGKIDPSKLGNSPNCPTPTRWNLPCTLASNPPLSSRSADFECTLEYLHVVR